MKSGEQWRKTLDAADPCWDLFSYKLILNESRFLSRAIDFLKGAGEANLFPSGDLHEIEGDLLMVKKDVDAARLVLTDTINMVPPSSASLTEDIQFRVNSRSRVRVPVWVQSRIPFNIGGDISSNRTVDGNSQHTSIGPDPRGFLE
jgi:hypothetical protein